MAQVDGHGLAGVPGSITFAVHALMLTSGQSLPLTGMETLEGRSLSNKVAPWR